ncbi:MAG: type II secretion system protein GspC [Pseudomonadota bacterium]
MALIAWLEWWQTRDWDSPWLVRTARLVAHLVLLSLVILLSWQLANLVWLWQTEAGTAEVAVSGVTATQPQQAPAPAIYDLFPGVVKPKPIKTRPAAPKKLRLTLRGVYATSDPKAGLALISSANAAPRKYVVGAQIQSGVTLYEVYADHVVLLRGSDFVELALPKNTRGIEQRRAPAKLTGMPGDPVILQKPQLVRKLQRYRQQLRDNPMAMGRLINGVPVMRAGKIHGLQVAPGTDPVLLTELGLERGDILISLNDTAVNDIKNLPGLLRTLSEDKQFDLVLERQGIVQTLNIYLEL